MNATHSTAANGGDSGAEHGTFVVIVGPDGVGKTTLARTILDRSKNGGFYFHFIPSPPTRLLDRPPDHEELVEKGRGSGSKFLGLLRIVRNVIRAWLGYILAIRPAVREGSVVVGDRWLYGYAAQPATLKFYGPPWLARLALKAIPKPDLIILLEAPAQTVHDRKPELTVAEIEEEAQTWRSLEQSMIRLDATQKPDHLASVVSAHLRPCAHAWPSPRGPTSRCR